MNLQCCKSNFKTTTFQIKIFNDVLFIANIIMSSKVCYLFKIENHLSMIILVINHVKWYRLPMNNASMKHILSVNRSKQVKPQAKFRKEFRVCCRGDT